MIFLGAFGASFFYVALKAFQQLNVVHDKRKWIVPVSIGMGLCEVFIMGSVAVTAVGEDLLSLFWLGILLGLGGSIGALLSMSLHKKLR